MINFTGLVLQGLCNLRFGFMIHAKQLRCMGIPPSFFAMFSKGDNFRDFLFAYLEDEIFPKWGLLLKERLCSDGDKFFFL